MEIDGPGQAGIRNQAGLPGCLDRLVHGARASSIGALVVVHPRVPLGTQ
jgi:hypothetical protein